ncbi:MAG: hypothetical protein KC496_05270, partial [Anaerolineae bacterium]|nr:hypothetical protein [Anaerolineae bacterium]
YTLSSVAAFFLEDQAAFLEAVGVENAEVMSVFLMDRVGRVYWHGSGIYSESTGDELSAVVSELFAS